MLAEIGLGDNASLPTHAEDRSVEEIVARVFGSRNNSLCRKKIVIYASAEM